MSESYLCPLSTHSALLRPIALWSLDTFGKDPPMLLGVSLGEPKALFHPVSLDPFDPIGSLSELIAPDSWDVLAIVTEAVELGFTMRDGVVAHVIDRTGRSATELEDWCGRRRSLHTRRGRLHAACLDLFVHPEGH